MVAALREEPRLREVEPGARDRIGQVLAFRERARENLLGARQVAVVDQGVAEETREAHGLDPSSRRSQAEALLEDRDRRRELSEAGIGAPQALREPGPVALLIARDRERLLEAADRSEVAGTEGELPEPFGRGGAEDCIRLGRSQLLVEPARLGCLAETEGELGVHQLRLALLDVRGAGREPVLGDAERFPSSRRSWSDGMRSPASIREM